MKLFGNTPKDTDRVIIRRWKDRDGHTGIDAFLPDQTANIGRIVCYSHIGQHGEADLWYYHETKPADLTAPEEQALIAELKSIGYNVRLVKRLARPFGGWAK